MLKVILYLVILAEVATRDPSIGVTSFGSVKVPSSPVEFDYPMEEQKQPYKIMVSSLFFASEKRVMDKLALELSTIKWP